MSFFTVLSIDFEINFFQLNATLLLAQNQRNQDRFLDLQIENI
jgi:hypothetical protein